MLLSLLFCVSMVISLAFCLCWRKKTPKNEWLGLDGMVTQKNPDENVNHLPSAIVNNSNIASNTNDDVFSNDSVDSSKRNTTNTRRSLPDIPSEQSATVNWEPTGDNSSEHYATVGQYQNSASKTQVLSNGVDARPSISQHSSISQADDSFSPYERVKYDKIKSKEHPYAQVQPTTSRQVVFEENHTINEERTTLLNTGNNEPVPPTRSRRSSVHSGHQLDIPAASAVAGGIAASPDLPYMTPPIVQSNFSGDSQDSSKGYTSISVREPLANILAQTKQQKNPATRKRDLDPHYSTVSDDSDDVYTTIPDPNNAIYTSESETYARIPAMPIQVEAEINNTNSCDGNDEVYGTVQPPPPSVDSLKQVTGHSHSRQASSSSSIANIGSPKPEKRQANSPLPPPPTSSTSTSHTTLFDFHLEKTQQIRNLDDLYAKVHKSKKEEQIMEKKQDNVKPKEHNYETLKKTVKKSLEKSYDDGYEKVGGNIEEPGYASINGPDSITSSDPGYEVLKQNHVISSSSDSDPNYEQLKDGYSVVNKTKQKIIDEPNYESMSGIKSTDSESDPNYESVRDLEMPYERFDDDSSSKTDDLKDKFAISSSDSSSGASKSEPPYELLNNTTNNDDEHIFQV